MMDSSSVSGDETLSVQETVRTTRSRNTQQQQQQQKETSSRPTRSTTASTTGTLDHDDDDNDTLLTEEDDDMASTSLIKKGAKRKRGVSGSGDDDDNKSEGGASAARGRNPRPTRAAVKEEVTSTSSTATSDVGRPTRTAATVANLLMSKSFNSATGPTAEQLVASGSTTSLGSVGSSTSTANASKKAGAARKGNLSSDAPQSLEMVAAKGALLDAVIRIKPPDVRVNAFGWSTRNDKYFVLTVYTAKGDRIAPDTYADVSLRYRVAALETSCTSKGSTKRAKEETTEEVLYDEAGKPTKGAGVWYFRVPQFKIPGTYSLSFYFPPDAPPAFRKLEPVTQTVSVLPLEDVGRDSPVPPRVGGGGDMVGRSTEKARALRSMAPSSSSLGGGVGGGGSIKRQPSLEEEFRSLVDESSDLASLVFKDREQKGRLLTLMVPGSLRRLLCEDWYAVTRRRRLVSQLPRSGKAASSSSSCLPSVGQIIKAYDKTLPGGASKGMGEKICTLFDGALGNLCLYRFEMNQFLTLLEQRQGKGKGEKEKSPHQIWGAEHLLRLLVICPRLLSPVMATTKVTAEEESALAEEAEAAEAYLQGLLDYLAAQKEETLFAAHEEAPWSYGLDVARIPRAS